MDQTYPMEEKKPDKLQGVPNLFVNCLCTDKMRSLVVEIKVIKSSNNSKQYTITPNNIIW